MKKCLIKCFLEIISRVYDLARSSFVVKGEEVEVMILNNENHKDDLDMNRFFITKLMFKIIKQKNNIDGLFENLCNVWQIIYVDGNQSQSSGTDKNPKLMVLIQRIADQIARTQCCPKWPSTIAKPADHPISKAKFERQLSYYCPSWITNCRERAEDSSRIQSINFGFRSVPDDWDSSNKRPTTLKWCSVKKLTL